MAKVKALVLRGSGLNCNNETEYALKLAGAETSQAHINELAGGKARLSGYHIMVIPGGFCYGDDLGAGKVMANQIRHVLKKDVQQFVDEGKLLAGICNGFQVLVKTGFLPGNCSATLTNNDSGHFEDRWITIKPAAESIFTKGIKKMYVPVNHGEGKFVSDAGGLKELNERRQIAFKYCDKNLNEDNSYPSNPNGSIQNIAAITNEKGNVFGMMPHPEKHISKYQHPRWTREGEMLNQEGDGLAIFRNMVMHAEEKLK